MILYVNEVTGIIDEVDGDSYLIDTDSLFTEGYPEDMSAEDLVAAAQQMDAAEEIAR